MLGDDSIFVTIDDEEMLMNDFVSIDDSIMADTDHSFEMLDAVSMDDAIVIDGDSSMEMNDDLSIYDGDATDVITMSDDNVMDIDGLGNDVTDFYSVDTDIADLDLDLML